MALAEASTAVQEAERTGRDRVVLYDDEVATAARRAAAVDARLRGALEAVVLCDGVERRLSVAVSVDDFGMGCSSLAYLARLPIDVLEIDHSLVVAVADPGTRAVVTTAWAAALVASTEGSRPGATPASEEVVNSR